MKPIAYSKMVEECIEALSSEIFRVNKTTISRSSVGRMVDHMLKDLIYQLPDVFPEMQLLLNKHWNQLIAERVETYLRLEGYQIQLSTKKIAKGVLGKAFSYEIISLLHENNFHTSLNNAFGVESFNQQSCELSQWLWISA